MNVYINTLECIYIYVCMYIFVYTFPHGISVPKTRSLSRLVPPITHHHVGICIHIYTYIHIYRYIHKYKSIHAYFVLHSDTYSVRTHNGGNTHVRTHNGGKKKICMYIFIYVLFHVFFPQYGHSTDGYIHMYIYWSL